ncbi:Hsp33 family molecular chaperone HslO [Texcoconibacillus texcoconensis]|uniref:33 kDa chaperonin n=1 Tax=Texcoconibacillus texcoconensis TaxID=1095777 RepID=A0A840QU22_9BACI|nr:Hsp33 family molecular chaperone HslO [Texcoconibacillus texcoconensis]MBB5174885.1 molecular chaperone Hsp33 [Texcoconibacillus texcoconensis]
MSDYLVKALAHDGYIRAYAIRSTEMVQEAARRHDTWRTTTAALGRSLSAGTMMGAMLKGEEKITVKIEGNGPASPIIIDSDSEGNARGYLKGPHVDPERTLHGKLNVAGAVGTEGTLSVVKYQGLKDPFTGSVPLVSGELGEDFTYYYAVSEQIPSSVGLGVIVGAEEKVEAAGGFIVQVLPGAGDKLISQIEERLSSIPPISQLLQDGLTPEEILQRLLGEDDVKFIDHMPVAFSCHCSKERVLRAIRGLDNQDIQEMIDEDEGAETQCHFCNEVYRVSKQELEQLLTGSEDEDL